MEAIETIEYRGRNIEIFVDEDPCDPREWDNLGEMACWHNRYTLGDKQPKCTPDEFIESLAEEASAEYCEAKERLEAVEDQLHWHFSKEDDEYVPNTHIQLWAKAQAFVERLKDKALGHYVILPLALYDHSGISMSVGRPSGWDCGQVGIIYCSLEDARKNFCMRDAVWDATVEWNGEVKSLRERTAEVLRAEVKTYDCYISGQAYGYVAGDDSCWGFLGYDHNASGLLEEAESAIDWQIENERKTQQAHTKTMIKNQVPLEKRAVA